MFVVVLKIGNDEMKKKKKKMGKIAQFNGMDAQIS